MHHIHKIYYRAGEMTFLAKTKTTKKHLRKIYYMMYLSEEKKDISEIIPVEIRSTY